MHDGIQTRRDLVNHGARELSRAKGAARDHPRREASLLLQAMLGCDRAQLLAHDEEPVNVFEVRRFDSLVAERGRGIPLPLLVGETDFHEITLRVEKGVFIPRPETELLVDESARVLDETRALDVDRESPLRVLDLCTGTGAIAVALANACRSDHEIEVFAGDWNPHAVRLARENAKRCVGTGRVDVRRSNLFSAFADLQGELDLVVSNPPYIDPAEEERLPLEVRLGDPREALFDPQGGTGFHSKIASRARDFLRPGGSVLLEIGQEQGADVETLLAEMGYCEVGILPDLAGRDRFARARWPGVPQPLPPTPALNMKTRQD